MFASQLNGHIRHEREAVFLSTTEKSAEVKVLQPDDATCQRA